MAAEALLKPRALVQPPELDGSAWMLKVVGFMVLVGSSAIVVSSWYRGFGAVSILAIFSFLDLGMLIHCLRLYARTPLASPGRREVLKIAAWLLVTMLLVTFFRFLEFWYLTMEN